MSTLSDSHAEVRDQSRTRDQSGVRKPRLVVGLDGSEGSLKALHWAAHRVEMLGNIQTVTAWHLPWWAGEGAPNRVADYHRAAQKRRIVEEHRVAQEEREGAFARQVRASIVRLLEDVPAAEHAEPLITLGSAGSVLVREARPPDVIVVGSRGRGAVVDAILGSVSLHCISHAEVPVVVVPSHAPLLDESAHVVVGVDGSLNSIGALVWALDHVPVRSKIEVIHVVDVLPVSNESQAQMAMGLGEELLDRTIDSAERQTTESESRELLRRVASGDARHVLLDASSGRDMLVIGARGRGRLNDLLLGSVASSLCHQPLAPTVVVPVAAAAGIS